MMLYQLHEFWRAGLAPCTYFADAGAKMYSAPESWLTALPGAQRIAASFELMYRLGKDYEKPEFGIHQIEVEGVAIPVVERVALEKPFCRLLRFKRYHDQADGLVVVALEAQQAAERLLEGDALDHRDRHPFHLDLVDAEFRLLVVLAQPVHQFERGRGALRAG